MGVLSSALICELMQLFDLQLQLTLKISVYKFLGLVNRMEVLNFIVRYYKQVLFNDSWLLVSAEITIYRFHSMSVQNDDMQRHFCYIEVF